MTTELQAAMIVAIAENECGPTNGHPTCTEECNTWSNMIVESAQDKGVVTSLINAGLVTVQTDPDPRESAIALTEAGYAEYLRLKGDK